VDSTVIIVFNGVAIEKIHRGPLKWAGSYCQQNAWFCYSPDVSFCGYTVPHPSENKINFRIQTSGEPAIEILRRGLKDLEEHYAYIAKEFKSEVEKFTQQQQFSSQD